MVDSATVVNNGTVSSEMANQIVPAIEWTIGNKYGLQKNHLMVLDLLATNNWERPIYFAITTGGDAYLGLEEYFQLEGLAYRLVPIKSQNTDGQVGMINTDIMYENMMNKYQWGNLGNSNVYLDETNMRMTMNFRNNFGRLANALIDEGEIEKALVVLDRCMEIMPQETIPFNYFVMPIVEAYYKAGAFEKGNNIATALLRSYEVELAYYFSFEQKQRGMIDDDIQQALAVVQRIMRTADFFKQTELSKDANAVFVNYYQQFTGMQMPQQPQQQVVPVSNNEAVIDSSEK